METIAAVVLAAGSSSRLGKPKQLLTFEGSTLLRRTVNAATAAGCHPVVVVVGSNEREIREQINNLPAIATVNERWRQGIGTSIQAGLSTALQSDPLISAVMLLVCDQPLIGANIIRELIACRMRSGKAIVAAQYGDTLGVPALFDRSMFEELLALPDETGAKPLIVSDPKRVAVYPFPEGAIDIDSAADYERFMADHANPPAGGTAAV